MEFNEDGTMKLPEAVKESYERKESLKREKEVNSKLYDTYRAVCKKEGWIVSRQFEKCMEEELKKRGREK